MAVQSVKDQYKTSGNLDTRINIYQYEAGHESFHEWAAERIRPGRNLDILELG